MDLCGDESQRLDLKYDIQRYQALLEKTLYLHLVRIQYELVREQSSHFLPFHVLYLLLFEFLKLSIILTYTPYFIYRPVSTSELIQCILT